MSHELHQLFDPASSTFTYMLVDLPTREAIVVDSVDLLTERDLSLVRRLGLTVRYVVETHAHADHVTGAGLMRARCALARTRNCMRSTRRATRPAARATCGTTTCSPVTRC